MRLIIRPIAAGEMDEAYRWYERQRQGLGEQFLECLQEAIDGDFPTACIIGSMRIESPSWRYSREVGI